MLPDGVIFVLFVLGFAVGILLLVLSFFLRQTSPVGSLLALLTAAVCLIANIAAIQTAMADFSFDGNGVCVKYPLEKEKFYPWEDFQQVCVCYYSRATQMNGYPLICLVRKGEKKDLFGRWKTGSLLHYRKLLCLDYSHEQLLEIQKVCPCEISDLRGKGNYKI